MKYLGLVFAALATLVCVTPAAAVTFSVQGTLRYDGGSGDVAASDAIANALQLIAPLDYDFTMIFNEQPFWDAQSFDLQVGDNHWVGDSNDWAYGYLSAFDNGVFFNVAFDYLSPELGQILRINFGVSFQQMSLIEDSPSNNPADYLAAGRSYVNFNAILPGVAAAGLRSNLPSLTGPNDPVGSVAIDGEFMPRAPAIIPEPSIWAMMLIGFVLAGARFRQSRFLIVGRG